MLVGDRGRPCGIYRELLTSLVARDGVMEKLADGLKRKMEKSEGGDFADREDTNGTETTDDGDEERSRLHKATQQAFLF